jgi:hypothetical protein
MRYFLLAVLVLGCGGAQPAPRRIEHVSPEPPPADLTTDPELVEFVLIVEEVAEVAIAGQECAKTGRELLTVIAKKREVIREYHRAQSVELEFAEMTEGDDLLHLRKETASRDIVDRWDSCAEDPTWDAMYRILFLGE